MWRDGAVVHRWEDGGQGTQLNVGQVGAASNCMSRQSEPDREFIRPGDRVQVVLEKMTNTQTTDFELGAGQGWGCEHYVD